LDGIVECMYLTNATLNRRGGSFFRRLIGRYESFEKKSSLYVSCEGDLYGKRFCLVKPVTFMNESGRAFTSMKSRGIIKNLTEVLVVVDDVDLNIGRVRLRARGSAGGHKGLKSIISALGTDEFARLRVGIGPRPNGEDLVKYVLGKFKPEEKEILDRSLDVASTFVKAWITGGFETAQSLMHGI